MTEHRRYRIFMLLWLVVLIGAAPLAAQPIGGGPGQAQIRQRGMREGDHSSFQRRGHQARGRGFKHRMRDRLPMVKMWKLTEYLDLSEEQGEKFFPRMRAHQKAVDELNDRGRKLRQEYLEKLDDSKVPPREVDRFLDAVAEWEKSRVDLRTGHIRGLKDVLSEEQYARLAVFDYQMRARIRQRFQDAPPAMRRWFDDHDPD